MMLAGIGLFGLMSYTVSSRTREIGIRIALGAQPDAILGLILRESVLLSVVHACIRMGRALGVALIAKHGESMRKRAQKLFPVALLHLLRL